MGAPHCAFPILAAGSLVCVLFNIMDNVSDRLDALDRLVRDLGVELIFQAHHQINDIQRIGAEIFDDRRIGGN